jgi:hypothetical protein|tara:strand:+ start:318 stop:527 length:210 start_codon:yes stop_codon:yes gene_type:complete
MLLNVELQTWGERGKSREEVSGKKVSGKNLALVVAMTAVMERVMERVMKRVRARPHSSLPLPHTATYRP